MQAVHKRLVDEVEGLQDSVWMLVTTVGGDKGVKGRAFLDSGPCNLEKSDITY